MSMSYRQLGFVVKFAQEVGADQYPGYLGRPITRELASSTRNSQPPPTQNSLERIWGAWTNKNPGRYSAFTEEPLDRKYVAKKYEERTGRKPPTGQSAQAVAATTTGESDVKQN